MAARKSPGGQRVRLRALAKINLDLRVLGRRPDGYHELRTVFHTISMADDIEVEFARERRTSIEIDCATPIDGNLIEPAARLALEAMGISARVRFRLEKRIPVGGGLGGGSSDAAAVLLALPVLAGRPLAMEKLTELAARLGSDVPFFLFGGVAAGLGRGDQLYPLPSLPPLSGLVIAPGVAISTAEAYRALGRGTLTMPPDFNMMDSFQALVWRLASATLPTAYAGGWAVCCQNDFEEVVFQSHPRLQSLKRALRKLGAEPALLSGSGSSVFGIFATSGGAERACAAFGRRRAIPFRLVSRERYRSMWWRSLRELGNGKQWPPQGRRV